MKCGMVCSCLCCVVFCYNCLCAPLVIDTALLYGVCCRVLLYSCVRFCLTNVFVCLVCDVSVCCCLVCGLCVFVYMWAWGWGGNVLACFVCEILCDGVWCSVVRFVRVCVLSVCV